MIENSDSDLDDELLELLALALDGGDETRIAMILRLTLLSREAEHHCLTLESRKLTDRQS